MGKYHERRAGKMEEGITVVLRQTKSTSVQQSHLPAGIQTGVLAVRQAAVHDRTIKSVT